MAEDREYRQEVRKLLVDEFVCFAEADVDRVLEKFENSYTNSWHILHDAEEEGRLAKYPLECIVPQRGTSVSVTDIQINTLQSQQLKNELAQIVEFWNKSRREYFVWASGLFFSNDQDGKEQLLDADGKQVMMEWERPYMEKCIDKLRIDQDSHVLEIGFGCGYSANQIQKFRPRSHTIIECAPPVLRRLHSWAKDKEGVRVVEGSWQERLPDLGIFDCVFFDDWGEPGLADREMQESCPDLEYRKEYCKALDAIGGTHFHGFLNIVTHWHARVGSRISGYLHHPVEMHREDLEAVYEHIEVTVPDHCNYFPGAQIWPYALVPLFIKRDPGFAHDEDTTAGSAQSPSRSSSTSPSSERGRCDRSRSRSRSIKLRKLVRKAFQAERDSAILGQP